MPNRTLTLTALIPVVLALTACGIERRQERREDRREDRRERREETSRWQDQTTQPRAAQAVFWQPGHDVRVIPRAPLA